MGIDTYNLGDEVWGEVEEGADARLERQNLARIREEMHSHGVQMLDSIERAPLRQIQEEEEDGRFSEEDAMQRAKGRRIEWKY